MPPAPVSHNGVRHGARGRARREEIVRAAIEVIAERGFRGSSLAAVAEKVGLTQQGLLHYFPTKDELLIEVLRQRDEWDNGGSPEAVESSWTMAGLDTLVQANAARPELIRTFSALLGESVTEDHPAGEYFHDRYRRTRRGMESVLRREWGDRLPSGLTPAEVAPLLIAIMDGLQFQWLHEPDSVDLVASYRAFVHLLDPEDAR
ncbi:TetR/AcrR family transcriptional regulator [Glycomyces sp. L485]|uniref:TetR/AcrR family transcriptional regulator n=1 Tax=Glycomyces sp. L485 TaxID=2909235 RepID=UPI001F4ABFE5|nr:TetR/AcrR family transcriptional regulator [Glycomyces sp. L485]MCH7231159.1 TetR/AcrR family transcriptional regulator [Glycomyces sp. L485]